MKITIANAHSSKNPDKKIELELEGGNPYFAYIWIDDVVYTIYKKKAVSVKRVKDGKF